MSRVALNLHASGWIAELLEVPDYSSIGLVTFRRGAAKWRARIDLDKMMFLDPLPPGTDAGTTASVVTDRLQTTAAQPAW